MLAKAREVLVVAVLIALAATPGRGQSPDDIIPTPVEELPSPAPAPGGLPSAPPPLVPPIYQPPPPLPAPAPPPPPLFGPVDPGFDGWGPYSGPSPPPGYFFDIEVAFIRPSLQNRLINNFPLEPSGDFLSVPSASLPWTVAPWLEAGYRLPNSLGLVALSYRFFNTEGNATLPFSDGTPSAVRTRLTLNMIDLDYGTAAFSFAPGWWVNWRAGVRYADVFFDSTIHNDAAFQQASNNFSGVGPHARMEVNRQLGAVSGLDLYGRVDGSGLLGHINQNFREVLVNPDGTRRSGFFNQNSTQLVPTLLLQAGLHYTPPQMGNVHLFGGWIYEHWWYVGQLGFSSTNSTIISPSRGEFSTQGLFVRGQIDF